MKKELRSEEQEAAYLESRSESTFKESVESDLMKPDKRSASLRVQVAFSGRRNQTNSIS